MWHTTDDERAYISRKYLGGTSVNQLAREFDVSYETMRGRLRTWQIQVGKGPRPALLRNERIFEIVGDDLATAYWLGYLAGKASIEHPTRRYRTAAINVWLREADRQHLESFLEFVGSDCKVLTNEKTTCSIHGRDFTSRGYCHVTIRSDDMVNDIARHGVVADKAARIAVDDLAQDPHYWRGRLDARGMVGLDRPLVQMLGHAPMLRQFHQFAEGLVDLRLRLAPRPRHRSELLIGKTRHVRFTGFPAVVICRALYRSDGPMLARNAERVRKWGL